MLAKPGVVAALLTMVFVIGAVRCVLQPVNDPDVWWLAAAGRDWLARGHVPMTNAWSFTDANHPWVMHEGAYALLYATGLQLLGPAAIVIAGVAAASATITMVIAGTVGRARHPAGAAALATIVLLGGGDALFSPRPGYASIPFAAAMAFVAFAPSFGAIHAAVCVGIELAWTNAHGSFPLGIALLLRAAVAERAGRPARLLAALVATAATFVNPYGARIPPQSHTIAS